MLHAGLDLSRKRLDVCLLDDDGEHLDQLAIAPDVKALSDSHRYGSSGSDETACDDG
jgi:hypothetical protein